MRECGHRGLQTAAGMQWGEGYCVQSSSVRLCGHMARGHTVLQAAAGPTRDTYTTQTLNNSESFALRMSSTRAHAHIHTQPHSPCTDRDINDNKAQRKTTVPQGANDNELIQKMICILGG